MKALFTAIRKFDFEKVKTLIAKNPDLVNCVAKQPPKKDDGNHLYKLHLKREILISRIT